MSRFRVTIRGEGTELRGYATAAALEALASGADDPFLVVASLADDDYDPFLESMPDSLHEVSDFDFDEDPQRRGES